MQCEIITIGDEILIGQIVDTNSAWMAVALNEIGVTVKQISSVSDDAEHIVEALNAAKERAQVILITGGLGPTKDDITKKTLHNYFGGEMVFNADQFVEIERIFKSYGREVTAINRKQAEVPKSCTCLVNKNGTAPGMWFDVGTHIIVSMPGVPYEMKGLMQTAVIPKLKERFVLPAIVHRTFRTQGVGESMLAEWISAWEDALPRHMKLAYLPSPGEVKLRITAKGTDSLSLEKEVEEKAQGLYELIGEHIYAEGEMRIEQVVHEHLLKIGKTLSLAESCTGGTIASLLTALPGASKYFIGSLVAYSNKIKVNELNVSASALKNFGAVSEQTVIEMALGACKLFKSDYSVAVSGIAGPDGGTDEKPVGTVWIAVAGPRGVVSKKFRFSTNRERNIRMAALAALKLLIHVFTETKEG
jgi:nicotinamide-nucleotide amidase